MAQGAHWDTSINWKGKRVAVIGTGLSSIQMIPEMAQVVRHGRLGLSILPFIIH